MSKTEYRVVDTSKLPHWALRGSMALAVFTTAEGGEDAARAFARMHKESNPAAQLEIDVVFTKSETTRIIRL